MTQGGAIERSEGAGASTRPGPSLPPKTYQAVRVFAQKWGTSPSLYDQLYADFEQVAATAIDEVREFIQRELKR